MKLVKRHKSSLMLVLFCLGLVFIFSGQVVTNVSAIPREDYESLETFTSILSIVKKNYVDEVNSKDLVNGAINGMLSSLDPHSAFLTPDLYKDLQMDTQGRFGGLGIEITIR
ncbi:MAG TPA: peptidase S41, partial [Candidatus Binatia bacterium]